MTSRRGGLPRLRTAQVLASVDGIRRNIWNLRNRISSYTISVRELVASWRERAERGDQQDDLKLPAHLLNLRQMIQTTIEDLRTDAELMLQKQYVSGAQEREVLKLEKMINEFSYLEQQVARADQIKCEIASLLSNDNSEGDVQPSPVHKAENTDVMGDDEMTTLPSLDDAIVTPQKIFVPNSFKPSLDKTEALSEKDNGLSARKTEDDTPGLSADHVCAATYVNRLNTSPRMPQIARNVTQYPLVRQRTMCRVSHTQSKSSGYTYRSKPETSKPGNRYIVKSNVGYPFGSCFPSLDPIPRMSKLNKTHWSASNPCPAPRLRARREKTWL